jgi:DNA-binding XRE family transcriptional regulator
MLILMAFVKTLPKYLAENAELSLTQGGLAARLGVTRKTINSRETGATRITEEAAMAIKALVKTRPC